MDEKEAKALQEKLGKAEADVAKFSGETQKLADELAAVKAQRDQLLTEKNETERKTLLGEMAKFAKKFGDKEPAQDAKLEDLRALRAGYAEKALAKFAEAGKAGADIQRTTPPAGEDKSNAPKARLMYVE